MKLTISRKVLVIVAIPVIFQLAFVVVLSLLLRNANALARQEENAKEAIAYGQSINKSTYDIAVALLGYSVTRNQLYSRRFDALSDEILASLHGLRTKVIDSPAQVDRVSRLTQIWQQTQALLNDARENIDRGGLDLSTVAGSKFKAEIQSSMDAIIAIETELCEQERKEKLQGPYRQAQAQQLIGYWISGFVVFNICLALAMTVIFNRSTTSRLQLLMENTNRFARGEKLIPSESAQAGDEISSLDQTFREMATAITQLLEKERAIVNNIPVSLLVLDESSTIESINPACQKLLGTASEVMRGQPLQSWLVSPIDWPTLRDSAQAGATDLHGRKANGQEFPLQLFLSHFQTAGGKRWLAIVVDVSQQFELDRLKQEFFAMVSHDVRTPAAAIRLFLQMLVKSTYGDLNERGKHSAHLALNSVNKVIDLVGDLLDIEKLEAGMLDIHKVECKLNQDVLRPAAAMCEHLAIAKDIEIALSRDELSIKADRERLHQVVVNLVSNAIKFSPEKTVIAIAVHVEGTSARVSVRDQGRGIPEEKVSTIFDRFRQVESSDADQRKGSGLGLAICKGIIEAHGGTVGVESQAGQGSTFWFTLPLAC